MGKMVSLNTNKKWNMSKGKPKTNKRRKESEVRYPMCIFKLQNSDILFS
jgi:hypothetical protein